ncbi:MAG: CAP domain-containing protein, partial [Flavobacteriales bacterium]
MDTPRLLIGIFFLFISLDGIDAQGPNSRVVPESLDEELLRKELHRAINELRSEQDLQALEKDPELRKAAQEQVRYISDQGRLTHYQDDPSMRTPSQRVLQAGGNHRPVGENLFRVFVDQHRSYRELADSIAAKWKASPPHYANIIRKAYKRTGIAFRYDEEGRSLYVTQVFAGHPPSFDVQEIPEPTPYQRFISGIFPPCLPFDEQGAGKSLSFSNGRMVVDPYRRGKKFLREEYPLYVRDKNFRFDCGSGLVEESQKSYRLKERREMIRDAKRFSDKDLASIELFGKERFLDLFRNPDKMQVDFALPRKPFGKDSVYRTTLYFMNRGFVCKKIEMLDLRLRFNERLTYPELPFDTASVHYPSLVERTVHRDTLQLKVHFERSEKSLPLDRVREKMKELKTRKREIERLEVVVNASVEGSKKENKKLLKARRSALSKELDPIFEDTPPMAIEKHENWEQFREDLKGSPLDSMAERSKEALRSFVNEHLGDPLIDSLLHRQRSLLLKAYTKTVDRDSLDASTQNQEMVDRFNDRLDGLSDTTKKDYEIASMLEEMIAIQKRLQKGYMLGHVDRPTLRKLRTGGYLHRMEQRTVQLGWILYRKALFHYKVLEELRTQELLGRLQHLARAKVPGKKGKEKKLLDELEREQVKRWVTSNALLALRLSPLTASDPEKFLLCFPNGDNTERRSLCRGLKKKDASPKGAMENIEAFAQWRG